MAYLEKYKQWVNDEYFDEATRAELKNIENNDNEIKERFF
jgi:phosphoglucomutase